MRAFILAILSLAMIANVWAYCGDGVCNVVAGESRTNCCTDCSCGYQSECSDSGACVLSSEGVKFTGGAVSEPVSRLYGFDGAYAALVATLAIGVLVLYKLRK